MTRGNILDYIANLFCGGLFGCWIVVPKAISENAESKRTTYLQRASLWIKSKIKINKRTYKFSFHGDRKDFEFVVRCLERCDSRSSIFEVDYLGERTTFAMSSNPQSRIDSFRKRTIITG